MTRPNFGSKDEEVSVTQSNIDLAERLHQATLHAEFDHPAPIADLTRPNFGNYDSDVAVSLKHTSLVEKDMNHKMKAEYPRPEVIADLTRPNFGDHDEEIAYTQRNIRNAEALHEATLHAVFSHA